MSSYKLISDDSSEHDARSIAFSAFWYYWFSLLELCLITMTDESLNDDPAWLMLPFARRQAALKRLNVLEKYESHVNPGEQEVLIAADELGITPGQFYRIRRQWLKNRSVMDLLPYGRPGAQRNPRLDQDVAVAMGDLIVDAIAKDGIRSPAEILRRVQKNWPLEKPIPSHMTVRKNITDALEKLTDVSGGLASLNSRISKDVLEAATGYGDVIAVDHICLRVFVMSEGGPVVPIATFAIDLFTSSITGFHLSFGAPGPLQFEEALRDAAERSKQNASGQAGVIKPKLVFDAGGSGGWYNLISRIEAAHYHASIRRSHRLNFGGLITSLVGTKIGSVNVSSRKILNDTVFNPGTDPLIMFDELKRLIEDGIHALNERRIPTNTPIPALRFDFLEQ